MTTYNTGNPVGSTDARDLYDNSQALDQLVNGSGTYANRLGVQRRTLAKLDADFDAQLADAESDLNVYRSEAAASAGEALGYLQTIRSTSYGAYASDPATDPLGNPPTVGDEYFNTTANLLKRWNGTTWQASDINTANLAASSGSSLVGYDGGTVQDVLDGAKSLQDYAALRAYTGRAKRVYITGLLVTKKPVGIAGVFQYDQTDTTSADNGGTIIVSADGRRWKRDFSGAVNIKWFGAKGDWDGTTGTDDTAAWQAAYNALANNRIGSRGLGRIYMPRGQYLMNESVSAPSVISLIVEGDGSEATQIIRTVDSGNLFNISTYIYVELSDLGIYHITNSNRSIWTTNCFSFSGNGGGREFCLRRVTTSNFNRISSFVGTGGNEDTNYFEGCTFNNFKTFLYSRNSQAVINKATQCTWFGHVDRVFDISGFGITHIDTANIVQSGSFLYLADGYDGPSSQYLITNAKFEFWNGPNANNTNGTTKIVEFENNAGNTAYIRFVNGGISGGTPDPAVYQWDLRGGGFILDVVGGQWGNTKIQTIGRTAQGGHNAWWARFANCITSPSTTINRIAGAAGASHVPVAFNSCIDVANILLRGPGGLYGGENSGNGKIAGIALDRNQNTKNNNGSLVISSTTTTHSFPSYGQLVLVEKIRVVVTGAAGWTGAEIKAFADAALTIQIGATITPAGGTWSSPTAYVYDITVPAGTFTSEGVYVTVKNTNGSGGASGLVYVDTLSV